MQPIHRAQLHSALAEWFERPILESVTPYEGNQLLRALGIAAVQLPDGPWPRLFDRLWEEVKCPEGRVILKQLEVEHARLFLVPSPERLQPYEHHYAHRDPGEVALELRTLFQTGGFDVSVDFPDLCDHISLELEFQAHLLAAGRTEQARSFFHEHLSHFHPCFAHDLRAGASSPLHQIVADTLDACMDYEAVAGPATAARNSS
jgi:TorA maturation chaperone TorD